jgi:hypothetical protein
MYVNLLTASEPRIPNPITATRTTGIGSHARRKTSCCPFGRFGVLVFIVCACIWIEKPNNISIPANIFNNFMRQGTYAFIPIELKFGLG